MKKFHPEELDLALTSIFKELFFLNSCEPEEDSLRFLVDETSANLENILISIANLESIISEHLLSLQLCETRQQCNELCRIFFTKLQDFIGENAKVEDIKEETVIEEVEDNDCEVDDGLCEMCDRDMPRTYHHLIPRSEHRRLLRYYDKKEMHERGIMICGPCHKAVHRIFTNVVLANEYNTLDKLLESEDVMRWIKYARKQKVYSKDHAIRGLHYAK
ncbi:hypothetical protein HK096_007376 [Nowakowskiella sp. JEL0078]|nr:hypothetical protein HK096_007376 [Nowakowskiella sp. JEL0078]